MESFLPVLRTAGHAFIHRDIFRSNGPFLAFHCERTNSSTSIAALRRAPIVISNFNANGNVQAHVAEKSPEIVRFQSEEKAEKEKEEDHKILDCIPDTVLREEAGSMPVSPSKPSDHSSLAELTPEKIVRAIIIGGIVNKVVSSSGCRGPERYPFASYNWMKAAASVVGVSNLIKVSLIRRPIVEPGVPSKARRKKRTRQFPKVEAGNDAPTTAIVLKAGNDRLATMPCPTSTRVPNLRGSKRWTTKIFNPSIKRRMSGRIGKLTRLSRSSGRRGNTKPSMPSPNLWRDRC